MGLGPAICQHCQVFAEFTKEAIPVVRNASTQTVSKWTNWYCPICGETDPNHSAGFGDWSKYEENEKFLRFILNKEKQNDKPID
jgi:hypothetical protein